MSTFKNLFFVLFWIRNVTFLRYGFEESRLLLFLVTTSVAVICYNPKTTSRFFIGTRDCWVLSSLQSSGVNFTLNIRCTALYSSCKGPFPLCWLFCVTPFWWFQKACEESTQFHAGNVFFLAQEESTPPGASCVRAHLENRVKAVEDL